MKDVLRKECTGCHTPAFPLQNRFDEAGWTRILTLMSRISVFGGAVHIDQAPNPVIQYYKKRLAAYLTEMRGPGPSPVKFKVRPRPAGESAMAVITEYDTPVAEGDIDLSNGSDWSLGHVSHLNPEHHHEHDAVVDLNGNLWITDQSPNLVRTIAKIDAKTGKVTPFKVPGGKTPNGGELSLGTHAMVRDANGILWADVYTTPGGLMRMDPSTEKFEVFIPPAGSSGVGSWVNMDGLGRVWSNSGSGANLFDPETKKFTDFKAISQLSPDGSPFGYGVTGDSQGNGWWSQISIDRIGFVNMKAGGTIEEIKLPPVKSAAVSAFTGQDREVFERSGAAVFNWATPWSQAPRRMGADLNSHVIYVPLWHGQSIAQININTKEMKLYPIPTLDGGPYETRVDKDHMVWVDFQNSDTIGKLDPQTGKWTEYSLPTLGCESHGIGVQDAGPIQVTVACFRAGKIERLQLRSKEDLHALKMETQKMAQAH
jgi:streptogramin lyase